MNACKAVNYYGVFLPLTYFLVYDVTEFIMNVGGKNMSPKSINKLVSTHFLYLNNLKREAELICLTNGDISLFYDHR